MRLTSFLFSLMFLSLLAGCAEQSTEQGLLTTPEPSTTVTASIFQSSDFTASAIMPVAISDEPADGPLTPFPADYDQ